MVEIRRRSRFLAEADGDEQQTDQNGAETEEMSDEERAREAENKNNIDALKDKYVVVSKQREDAKKAYNDAKSKIMNNITLIKSKDAETDSPDNKSQIVGAYNQLRTEKDKFEQAVKQAEMNMLSISDNIAALNGDISDGIVESMMISFSRNLYESVGSGNRTDELKNIIIKSFDDIPALSYQPSDVRCRTYAKNIINFINKQNWTAGENHWDDFVTYMTNILDSSTISLGKNEKSKFLTNLKNNILSSDMFVWRIFGNNARTLIGNDNGIVTETVGQNGKEYWEIGGVSDDVMDIVEDKYRIEISDGLVEYYDDSDEYVIIVYDENLANDISNFVESIENEI